MGKDNEKKTCPTRIESCCCFGITIKPDWSIFIPSIPQQMDKERSSAPRAKPRFTGKVRLCVARYRSVCSHVNRSVCSHVSRSLCSHVACYRSVCPHVRSGAW